MEQSKTWPAWNYLPLTTRMLLWWRVWRVVRKYSSALSVEVVAVRSVGVVGDSKSYDPTIFLKPHSGFTYSPEQVAKISTDIINKVPGIGRVLLDIVPDTRGSL